MKMGEISEMILEGILCELCGVTSTITPKVFPASAKTVEDKPKARDVKRKPKRRIKVSTKCRTCDKVCSYRVEDYVPEYVALLARVARLEEALRFILDECDWEESMQHACGDNRIGTAARRALEEKP